MGKTFQTDGFSAGATEVVAGTECGTNGPQSKECKEANYWANVKSGILDAVRAHLTNRNDEQNGQEKMSDYELEEAIKATTKAIIDKASSQTVKAIRAEWERGYDDNSDAALLMQVIFEGIIKAETSDFTPGTVSSYLLYICPLVLDLNGDGVQTLASDAGVEFDFDGDGTKEKTGWLAPKMASWPWISMVTERSIMAASFLAATQR